MTPDSLALGIRGLDPLSIDLIIDHTLPWPGSYTNDSYICMYPAYLLDQETGSYTDEDMGTPDFAPSEISFSSTHVSIHLEHKSRTPILPLFTLLVYP